MSSRDSCGLLHRTIPSFFSAEALIATGSRQVVRLTNPHAGTAAAQQSDVDEAALDFAYAAAIGLTDTPRWLPCRFLYDARGSELFEQITQQPEYYLTRMEASILATCAADIRTATGPVTLIELGSGSSAKTSHLLAAYSADGTSVRYVPVDVSSSALRSAEERIAKEHPQVRVTSIAGTYEQAFPRFREHAPCIVLLLGSTIGNFNHNESLAFWRRISKSLQPGDFFLLGVDLVKDVELLEAAYNDAAGVTAEFTKNLLVRMNRELGAGVDVLEIEHVARYNSAWQRIETFVRFNVPQTVRIEQLDLAVELAAGEQIIIEISRKFVLDDLTTYLSCFGFAVRRVYTDDRKWFGVVLLQKGDDRD